jgi:NADPH:quinone reductase-like Zn-dependent oxidoreductase
VRAAVVTQCGRSPQLLEHPDPHAGNGEALVRVTAAPITPLDFLCASGTSYWGPPAVPYVPGVQGIGEVIEGSALRPGSQVWFPTTAGMAAGDGSMAELAAVGEASAVALPDGLAPTTAAALGLSAVAALLALTSTGRLSDGECVVVLGAAGTVGQCAVQLARHLGASRVVGVVHRPASRVRAEARGADLVVDTSQVDPAQLADVLREACGGGSDLVIDAVFGPAATAALATLRAHGRLVQLGGAGSPTATFDSATIRSRSLAILGYTNAALSPQQTAAALTTVFELAARGTLDVDHGVHALAEVETAWSRQASGEASERAVLVPAAT